MRPQKPDVFFTVIWGSELVLSRTVEDFGSGSLPPFFSCKGILDGRTPGSEVFPSLGPGSTHPPASAQLRLQTAAWLLAGASAASCRGRRWSKDCVGLFYAHRFCDAPAPRWRQLRIPRPRGGCQNDRTESHSAHVHMELHVFPNCCTCLRVERDGRHATASSALRSRWPTSQQSMRAQCELSTMWPSKTLTSHGFCTGLLVPASSTLTFFQS